MIFECDRSARSHFDHVVDSRIVHEHVDALPPASDLVVYGAENMANASAGCVVMANHASYADIVALFHARFDPGKQGEHEAKEKEISERIGEALEKVDILDEDRIKPGFVGRRDPMVAQRV